MAHTSTAAWPELRRRSRVLVAFARPHTVTGTAASLVALFVLAHALPVEASPGPADLVLALVAALAVNVFIVGVNQVTDVELDQVNKPWLPLPAGSLSVRQARRTVLTALGVAAAGAALAGPWLLTAVGLGAAFGAAYSVRPVRLKRHHLLAAGAIVAVRGLVVNLLVFTHFVTVGGGRPALPGAIMALTGIVVLTGLVIAWFKDLPDAEGDRRYGIGTLPIRVGPQRVLALGTAVLAAGYLGVAGVAAVGFPALHDGLLGAAHVVMAALLVSWAWGVDLDDGPAVTRFYKRIWLLFTAEYAVFALAAVLG